MDKMKKALEYNDSPIVLSEGKITLDDEVVYEGVTCTITATINTWSGKKIGSRKRSTRVTGVDYSGVVTERRSTPRIKALINDYLSKGLTPEFKMQGVMADKGSDYYANYGSQTVTCTGCVPTGDLQIFNLDADSDDVLTDTINFNIFNVTIK